jgi:hypothetical protein
MWGARAIGSGVVLCYARVTIYHVVQLCRFLEKHRP